MSLSSRATAKAARRSADRLRYEAGSIRLHKEVPALSTLRIAVTEHGPLVPINYVKHVMVGSAPALFVFECGDPTCDGGGHDVTSSILYSLRGMRTEFAGHDACAGTVGLGQCRRTIDFRAYAAYSS
jgi:hypothetical protein